MRDSGATVGDLLFEWLLLDDESGLSALNRYPEQKPNPFLRLYVWRAI
jgi:hypothetical protein